MSLILDGEQATVALGATLAVAVEALEQTPPAGLHLHLRGPLGAGKTTLVRGLLRALGVRGPVKSPTYTLVEPYRTAALTIYHFDLYRLGDPEELELIGARDYFRPATLCCVEWPERAEGWLPRPSLRIDLRHRGDGREAEPCAFDWAGRRLMACLRSAACSSVER